MSQIADWIYQYLHGQLEESERSQLDAWLHQSEENREVFNRLSDPVLLQQTIQYYAHAEQRGWEKIKKQLPASGAKKVTMKRRWLAIAAAACALLTATILWWSLPPSTEEPPVVDSHTGNVIRPGQYGALLTFADGRTVRLDSTSQGKIGTQAGADVISGGGTIHYQPGPGQPTIIYNTLQTGNGEMYSLNLVEGSAVTLNASASLRYFASLDSGGTRIAELQGEAYFRISHLPGRPFIIRVNDVQVRVFGTEINISGYADDPVSRATLVNGSAEVSRGTQKIILRPGEQARIGEDIEVTAVNLTHETAWVNGYFDFNEADVTEIMRQIGRWYDVQIRYQGKIPDVKPIGRTPRNASLKTILEILETLGIRTQLEGRTLTVLAS